MAKKFQFLDELGIKTLIKEIVARLELKIKSSITSKIDSESDDYHSVSAKKFYDTIEELKRNGGGVAGSGVDVVTHIGKLEEIHEPRKHVLYFQKEKEADTTWNVCVYETIRVKVEGESPEPQYREVDQWLVVGTSGMDMSIYWNNEDLKPMSSEEVTEKVKETLESLGLQSLNDVSISIAPEIENRLRLVEHGKRQFDKVNDFIKFEDQEKSYMSKIITEDGVPFLIVEEM